MNLAVSNSVDNIWVLFRDGFQYQVVVDSHQELTLSISWDESVLASFVHARSTRLSSRRMRAYANYVTPVIVEKSEKGLEAARDL